MPSLCHTRRHSLALNPPLSGSHGHTPSSSDQHPAAASQDSPLIRQTLAGLVVQAPASPIRSVNRSRVIAAPGGIARAQPGPLRASQAVGLFDTLWRQGLGA